MDLSGNISNLVFKKKIKADIGEFSLDSQMLKVLMSIDGKKTIDVIEKQLNLDSLSIKETLLKLNKLKLIEIDISSVATLDDDFYDYLLEQLVIAIGPMAEIIIEDVIVPFVIARCRIAGDSNARHERFAMCRTIEPLKSTTSHYFLYGL